MDMPRTEQPESDGAAGSKGSCRSDFSLDDVRLLKEDKLGHIVREFLWLGEDYKVYRTDRGVYVAFSDCAHREREQREAFTEICPELCELRFLTHEMHGHEGSRFQFWRKGRRGSEPIDHGASLFEHNIAQALMLLMEDRPEPAKAIARAALEMAVVRCTNDNTIRYVMASMFAAALAASSITLLGLVIDGNPFSGDAFPHYLTAALFGVLGAAFSVITRVQSFQMKPCQQSNMNHLMAWARIAFGLIAGLMLYLIVRHPLGVTMFKEQLFGNWEMVAVVGFLGGFAERLVPTVFRRTAAALEDSSGTPVQAARKFDLGTEPPNGNGRQAKTKSKDGSDKDG